MASSSSRSFEPLAFALARAGAGLVLLACSIACSKTPPRTGTTDAAAPPERQPLVTIVDPEEEKTSFDAVQGAKVKDAYDALVAGRIADARAILVKLGSPRAVMAKELEDAIATFGSDSRVLLDSKRPCELRDLGEDACTAKGARARKGSCENGVLKTVCRTALVDVGASAGDTKIVAAHAPWEIGARGKSIVTFEADAVAVVRDGDAKERARMAAYDLLPIDDDHLLAIDRPARRPDATDEKRTLRVLDVKTGTASQGCDIVAKELTSEPIASAGLAADGATLVVQLSRRDGNTVVLCRHEKGKLLGTFKPLGTNAWVADAERKTIYVGGIYVSSLGVGHVSNDYVNTTVVEHVAINAATGDVTGRARTSGVEVETHLALAPAADVLVVAIGSDVTMIGTKPFRGPPGPPPQPGYAPVLLGGAATQTELRALPDGASFVVNVTSKDEHLKSAERDRNTTVYSAKTRKPFVEGRVAVVLEDAKRKRSGLIVRATTNQPARVVVIDESGTATTRPLAPDEGLSAPMKRPPELEGMIDPATAPNPAQTVAEKLAPKLCAIGGLYVPRSVCFP